MDKKEFKKLISNIIISSLVYIDEQYYNWNYKMCRFDGTDKDSQN